MNLKRIRNRFRLVSAILCIGFYVPHIFIYLLSKKGEGVFKSDLDVLRHQIGLPNSLPYTIQLVYHLHNNKYYREVFYHRAGPKLSFLLRFFIRPDRYFNISATTRIGPSFWIAHPFSTIINAESIGANFRCLHNTTIGSKNSKRPKIGDNVSLGANVIIIGGVSIGNNVIIGAGSVVVKDIPDNCVAAGNPCKPLSYIVQ